MKDPSESHQSAGLAQLAELKRSSRRVPPVFDVVADAMEETVARSAVPAAGPSPWQFRLRTMFVLVACLGGLFAIMHVIGAVWSTMLVWFLLLAAAHVTANFWGTHVAPRAGRSPVLDSRADYMAPARQSAATIGAVRLRESRRPGWPMWAATAISALIGATLGGTALILLGVGRAGYAGVIVGTVSAATVGGSLGFLTGSFAIIASRAWKEALAGSRED